MPNANCTFGYCLASIPDGRSRYCSVEHEKAARSRKTADSIARRATEEFYLRVTQGAAAPPPRAGWVTINDGVVLDGDVVLELRALISTHRTAMQDLVNYATRPGVSTAEIARRIDDLVRKVDRPLLNTLDRMLPDVKPAV